MNATVELFINGPLCFVSHSNSRVRGPQHLAITVYSNPTHSFYHITPKHKSGVEFGANVPCDELHIHVDRVCCVGVYDLNQETVCANRNVRQVCNKTSHKCHNDMDDASEMCANVCDRRNRSDHVETGVCV